MIRRDRHSPALRAAMLPSISLLTVLAVLVPACTAGTQNTNSGGNEGTSGGGGGADTAAAFDTSYCNLIARCCGTQGLPADGKSCNELFSAASAEETYDSSSGAACLTAANNAANADPAWCAKSAYEAVNLACNTVFTPKPGAVAAGAACTADSDCAFPTGSKASCTGSTSGKICQVQTPGKAGDSPCVGTLDPSGVTFFTNVSGSPPAQGYICAESDGVYCASGGKCTALVAVGASCAGNATCAVGASCNFTNQQCEAPVAMGASCSAGQACATGTYCDSTNVCSAQLATGAACTSNLACVSTECKNDVCADDASSGSIVTAFLCGSASTSGN